VVDRILPKKRWSRKRILTISGIAAILILIGASYYFTSGGSKLDVDKDRITISEITKGPFQEFIPINGVVLPLTTIYLDADEGGSVVDRYVEDGQILKKGQPILKLSNTDLELNLANQETNVFDVLTQMQISRNNAEQNTISKLNQMADVDDAFKEAERVYKLDEYLYQQKVIGSQEYQQAKNAYEYQLRREKLAHQILEQDSVSTKQQQQQMQQSYQHMQNTLALMREKVSDLVVKAKVDGQLNSFDAEIGQTINKGEQIGQIDELGGFKIRADIDEHYISRVFTGLHAHFDFNDTTYYLKVKKVYSQVTNGTFQVDMEFTGKVPQGIRRGQTLQVYLTLSDETQAILLPRGGFYEQTGGNWIFKVSSDGKTAHRVNIELGRQNPDYYEVLEGLKPGDKVITSSYDTYGDVQQLVLK
jgi:HlyD family secretion protein